MALSDVWREWPPATEATPPSRLGAGGSDTAMNELGAPIPREGTVGGASKAQAAPRLTDEQAHEMGVSVRAEEFVRGIVDWTAVIGITEPLLAIADVPKSAKPRAAAAAVALIRRDGNGLNWRAQRVNIETLVAIFDVLSDGKHRGGCPGSAGGYHEWALAEVNPTGTTPVRIPMKNRRCQLCGLQG